MILDNSVFINEALITNSKRNKLNRLQKNVRCWCFQVNYSVYSLFVRCFLMWEGVVNLTRVPVLALTLKEHRSAACLVELSDWTIKGQKTFFSLRKSWWLSFKHEIWNLQFLEPSDNSNSFIHLTTPTIHHSDHYSYRPLLWPDASWKQLATTKTCKNEPFFR